MKKLISIPVIVILLFSGFTFNIAMHYCGGELAGTKISFSGKLAGCGMEHHEDNSNDVVFAGHCCENVVNSYTLDNNYFPSQIFLVDVNSFILNYSLAAGLPEINTMSFAVPTQAIKPPGQASGYSPNSVSREEICIFRI